jgi:hypothetical protein
MIPWVRFAHSINSQRVFGYTFTIFGFLLLIVSPKVVVSFCRSLTDVIVPFDYRAESKRLLHVCVRESPAIQPSAIYLLRLELQSQCKQRWAADNTPLSFNNLE